MFRVFLLLKDAIIQQVEFPFQRCRALLCPMINSCPFSSLLCSRLAFIPRESSRNQPRGASERGSEWKAVLCVSVCLQLPFSDSAGVILTMPVGFPEALGRVCSTVKDYLPPYGFRIIPPWLERSWQKDMKGEQPGSLGISPSRSLAYAPGHISLCPW